ncbi:MAG: glycosyltransferase, partial [Candidatus Competibacteraceae bacterium]|nr:glycosyltransferase [Candidatus Competibacteraceae bacterium]
QRRTELVACLNQADLLLAVSSWVRKVYVEYGLQPDKVRVNAIGSAIAALGRARPARPPKPAQSPLRLVFMGVADIYKGLPLLLQALAQLEDAELKQIDLALYAREIDRLEPAWRPLQTRLAALHIQDGYRYTDIPELLADRDLGVVAPIWWDNAPQVVFELLALGVPVLGARIGGIPDFVSDGRNGLLFEPDNAADLAAKLRQALREPDFINRMRAGIQPMKTLTEHADELEVFYSGHCD